MQRRFSRCRLGGQIKGSLASRGWPGPGTGAVARQLQRPPGPGPGPDVEPVASRGNKRFWFGGGRGSRRRGKKTWIFKALSRYELMLHVVHEAGTRGSFQRGRFKAFQLPPNPRG